MAKKRKEQKDNRKTSTEGIQNEKLCAVLSYLVVGIIWYFADENMKKSQFVKFHVKQGLVLLISEVIVSVIWSIPFLGWVIGPLLNLVTIILLIIGVVNAVNGKQNELPIIGNFAKGFNF
ncbi:MAG: hypothetical protein Q8L27_00860 [archaeon]|nr:hypothetical protein [archaeon]